MKNKQKCVLVLGWVKEFWVGKIKRKMITNSGKSSPKSKLKNFKTLIYWVFPPSNGYFPLVVIQSLRTRVEFDIFIKFLNEHLVILN